MNYEDLVVGQQAEISKVVTHQDIRMFADVSGDDNPVHFDNELAKKTPFEGIIAHGMLSATFISCVLGTVMPGPGTIYLGQTLKFLAPVRPGERVRTVVTIKELIREKRRAICATSCYVADKMVIDGEATVMVPA